jgi:diaminopropionate ammonia-lyase
MIRTRSEIELEIRSNPVLWVQYQSWDQTNQDLFLDYCTGAKGMRILGNPAGTDRRVISGESGAAALGCAAEILQNESLEYIRRILKLDQNSRILCFSTEGDTDKDNYRKIVWDGLYPSY